MSAEGFRDAMHNIIGETELFSINSREALSFTIGYLNGVFECIMNARACFSDEEASILNAEYDYIWDNIITWIKDGLDVKTEINRLGWNTRKMENEWWYQHEQS